MTHGGKRPGAGQPKIGDVVAVRMSTALVAQIERYAKNEGITRAEAVRQIVARGLLPDRLWIEEGL